MKILASWVNGKIFNKNDTRYHCNMYICGRIDRIDPLSKRKPELPSDPFCSGLLNKLDKMAKIKHGYSHHPIYKIFTGMKERCYYKTGLRYADYGGRGITICDEWLKDRISFFEWAFKNGYKKGLTIERKDNDKGYSPNNCVFTDMVRQSNNSRHNRIIEYNDEKMSLADFCRKYNFDYPKLQARLTTQKIPLEKAIIDCNGFKGTRIVPQKYSRKLKQCKNV